MNQVEELIYSAKLCEQSERYEEMVKVMKEVCELQAKEGSELRMEERNLLSVAYKNIVGSRRAAWRILSSIEHREEEKSGTNTGGEESAAAKNPTNRLELVSQYRKRVEVELKDICQDLINVLQDHLVEKAVSAEAKVFFLKMRGDYYRYLAEFAVGEERKNFAENSLVAYKAASEVANGQLVSTHPVRLGLALNFSVFYYEIINSPDRACKLAKQAFDEAIADLDNLGEDSYKDSTLIMQLLRDNLTLWTADLPQNDEGEAGDD